MAHDGTERRVSQRASNRRERELKTHILHVGNSDREDRKAAESQGEKVCIINHVIVTPLQCLIPQTNQGFVYWIVRRQALAEPGCDVGVLRYQIDNRFELVLSTLALLPELVQRPVRTVIIRPGIAVP